MLRERKIRHIYSNAQSASKSSFAERFEKVSIHFSKDPSIFFRLIYTLRVKFGKISQSGLVGNRAGTNIKDGMLILQHALDVYNSTVHSSTGVAPKNAHLKQYQEEIFKHQLYRDGKAFERGSRSRPKFKNGDIVRLKKNFAEAGVFTKSNEERYTQDQYRIAEVHYTLPLASYTLTTLDGSIYLPGTFSEIYLQ